MSAIKNEAVESSTAEMKANEQRVSSLLKIGVVLGLVVGLLTAVWIAGSAWTGTLVASSLAVMGASATLFALIAVNFASEND